MKVFEDLRFEKNKWTKQEILNMFAGDLNKVVHYCISGQTETKGRIDYTKNIDRVISLEQSIKRHHLENEYIEALLEVFADDHQQVNLFAFMHARPVQRCKAFCLTALKLVTKKEDIILDEEDDDYGN